MPVAADAGIVLLSADSSRKVIIQARKSARCFEMCVLDDSNVCKPVTSVWLREKELYLSTWL